MLKRLQAKFVCINMLLVTAMLCIILGLVYNFMAQSLEEESVRLMEMAAVSPFVPGSPEDAPEDAQFVCFVLRVVAGGVLVVSGDAYYDLSDEDFLEELLEMAYASHARFGILEEYNLRFCKVDTLRGQSVAFADISGERSTLGSLLKNCVMIGVAAFVLFLLISVFLARWAIRPVEKAWAQQRQFVADASHELKTPLTVILTNAEMLKAPYGEGAGMSAAGTGDSAAPYGDLPGAYGAKMGNGAAPRGKAERRAVENILAMAVQMRGLVENLLELARVDSGVAKATMAPVDFGSLIFASTLLFEPLCYEQGLGLRSQIAEGLCVKGDEGQLKHVVEILLDNAMKYSAPKAEIGVTLERRGRHCVLSVENCGEAIPAGELDKIFLRFYRADKARGGQGGYGLGLSIAAGIVKSHRGRIWASSEEGKNTFFVQLPLWKPH